MSEAEMIRAEVTSILTLGTDARAELDEVLAPMDRGELLELAEAARMIADSAEMAARSR